MKIYPYQVAGQSVEIKVPETREDLNDFKRWLMDANNRGPIALDTETTGLDIYSSTFRLRTVQFGDARTGWVIHWELGGWFVHYAERALEYVNRFLIHNAPYDWCVLDRHTRESIESLAPRTTDTRLLAGLVDPRQPQEGGRGTALKPLSTWYVDPNAADTQGDLTAIFRSLKLTKATGWKGIDLQHPTYNLYAGLDVIYTARLEPALHAELHMLDVRDKLVQYEHEIARICAIMQRKGMVLDVPYTKGLDARLAEESEKFAALALRYGVTSVNAPAQVRAALEAMGEEWLPAEYNKPKRAADGSLIPGTAKVDKAVLHRFADLDQNTGKPLGTRKPNPLAEAVLKSKRAGKWKSSYADTFIETVDDEGVVHPFINSMQARTSRMSVTRPALQTLPAGDWMIRRAMMAREGFVVGSTDFQAVELRVLAALADVKNMKRAIAAGEDLHSFTARLVFGPDFTPKHRKLSKGIAFGKVYGGGAATIQRQTGAPMEEVRRALAAYDRVYPEVKRMSNRWQREAYETGMVHLSVTGRRLPLDRDRMYAVVNYACQSVARDCLGQSLLNLEEAGLLDNCLLPVHDEVIWEAPERDADEVGRLVAQCMTFDLFGVPIEADSDLGGRSWGSLYMVDAAGKLLPELAIANDPYYAANPQVAYERAA